ncbi:MAG: PQ-loop domain-containing transporter [Patescibacteria group bacterium]
MTREQFVKKFHWNAVMFAMSFANVAALVPQPLKIIQTHETAGISVIMFVMFAFIQGCFAIEFYIKKSWAPMCSLAISMLLSLLTIFLYFLYR